MERTVTKKIEDIINKVGAITANCFQLPDCTEVSLTLVNDKKILELNRLYRNMDCPTDVLSFAFDESDEEEPSFEKIGDTHLLGDIIISTERAVVQAQEYGHSLEREIGFLFIHGLLHLLGFDHNEEEETNKMRQYEERILSLVDLSRE
jgi:probable rRNA maturation factor